MEQELIDELIANHEFLLDLYNSINVRKDDLNFNIIQQHLRDRMAKQLELINKATK